VGDTPLPDFSARLARLRGQAHARDLAALVIASPPNLQYLTGFDGSTGLLVVSASGADLLVDGRYEAVVRRRVGAGELAQVRVRGLSGSLGAALAEALADVSPGSIGFEAERVTVATLDGWQEAVPHRTFTRTTGLVERLRAIKDAGELAVLRRACGKLSDVARSLRLWVRAGRTEREVAADIDAALLREGFDRPAFQTIVASGPNSAHPHARPTGRRLAQGDLVVLDFGGVLDGYCGDLTRMASIGQVQADARALVDAVRAAQQAAIAAVRPGAHASDIDQAARRVLDGHGLGEAFLHATGHGLGLELHEAPRLGRADADRAVTLETGMVCTIEPGAYVEGLGGARMEDDIAVTPEGCEVLTSAPRDLLIV
jgi:Xaa-Pro aminopeptidase